MIVLGAIAFADMLCEGAAAEWSAVYLRDNKHTTLAFAGLGFTVYSLAMVSVRLSGNRLLRWQRPEHLLPVLAGVATFGLVLGLVSNETAVLLAGFGCLGFGLALVVPTVFSAAGRVSGVNPGTAIAVVSAFGWTGFVCGPPTHRSDRVRVVPQDRSRAAPDSDRLDRVSQRLARVRCAVAFRGRARCGEAEDYGASRSRENQERPVRSSGCGRATTLVTLNTPAFPCAAMRQRNMRPSIRISAG